MYEKLSKLSKSACDKLTILMQLLPASCPTYTPFPFFAVHGVQESSSSSIVISSTSANNNSSSGQWSQDYTIAFVSAFFQVSSVKL